MGCFLSNSSTSTNIQIGGNNTTKLNKKDPKVKLAISKSINFIPFINFKKHGSLPKYVDNKDLCITYDKINTSNALLIYISYNHNDYKTDDNNPKEFVRIKNYYQEIYQICIIGIEKYIKNKLAPELPECYIWMDYCCTLRDCDKKTVNETNTSSKNIVQTLDLRCFDDIIKCCDCVFSPVYNPYEKKIEPKRKGILVKTLETNNTNMENSNKDKVSSLSPSLKSGGGGNESPSRGSTSERQSIAEMTSTIAKMTSTLQLNPIAEVTTTTGTDSNDHEEDEVDVEASAKAKAIAAKLLPPSPPLTWYLDYPAPCWQDSSYGYVYNGWNRVELFYNAYIPNVLEMKKLNTLKGSLKHHCKWNLRPHYIYGSAELLNNLKPVLLPTSKQIHNLYKKDIHPLFERDTKNFYSSEREKIMVDQLFEYLTAGDYMTVLEIGYTGERDKAGKMHGQGKYIYSDGSIYEGRFQQELKDGTGCCLKSPNGDIYYGDFKNDEKHGVGNYTYDNGDSYEGHWSHGKKSGHGVFIFSLPDDNMNDATATTPATTPTTATTAETSKYSSSISSIIKSPMYSNHSNTSSPTKMNSTGTTGTAIQPLIIGGGRYEGDWVDDKKSGHGTFYFPNGDKYVGEWLGDLKHGPGEFSYANGSVFAGVWVHDLRTGAGRLTQANGSVIEGVWEQDRNVSHVKIK